MTDNTRTALRAMDIGEFVRRLKTDTGRGTHFAFFLGAGCSISSGIPAAGDLVKNDWLRRLHKLREPGSNFDDWVKKAFPQYDPANPAYFYGETIKELFPRPILRQEEMELLCDNRTPSFGYAALARLIAMYPQYFNVVLSTNFDDLLADAFSLYTEEVRPLVIAHELLAEFIRPTPRRPLLVKLHGDAHLAPRNTELETEKLELILQQQVARLLHDCGLIIIGYAGADKGIIELLKSLPKTALPYDIYWLNPAEPQSEMRKWLCERDGVAVCGEQAKFDEVMAIVFKEFALTHPKKERFDRIFDKYYERYKELERSVAAKLDDGTMRQALDYIGEQFTDYWQVINRAERLEQTEPEQADALYRQGIEKFPYAVPLLNNYASFLTNIRKDHSQAEEMYKRALEEDKYDEGILGNYALFLTNIRKDYDQAEKIYKRALEEDNYDEDILGNYAFFLIDIRKDYDQAEKIYKRVLEENIYDANIIGNYASFLTDIRKDHDQAEEIYKRALEEEPDDAGIIYNYAVFLHNIREDHDRAEEMYKLVLEEYPDDSSIICNYAIFLHHIRKDYDQAEKIYKRALEGNIYDANILGNYASFLTDIRKDHDQAEEIYKQALEEEPDDAAIIHNYAIFLDDIRKDYDQAEEMYKQALAAEPNNANNLGNYAIFLRNIRKDYDQAEEMYKQALLAEPNNANNLGSYAIFLNDIRKDYDQAEEMYKQALLAEPNNANNLGNYAIFLNDIRKDYDQAEEMYKQALAAEPNNANNLGNYAIFLNNIRKDYDQAEEMYKQALLAEPNNANNLGNYAIFLNNIRKNYDQAEEMYKQALAAESNNANILGNYAGFLLAHSKPDGREVLAKAMAALSEAPPNIKPALELECVFYSYAHGPASEQAGTLHRLRALLATGARSPSWDLSANIDRALQYGHPEGPWLAKLAAVINDEAPPASLDDWPAWQAAG